MLALLIAATILNKIGMGLALGSSTFALIFFFQSIRDGVIDATEKRFLHTVYFVMRLGLGIIIATELIIIAIVASTSADIFADPTQLFRYALIAIIIANAFLMDRKLMPMRIGPVIAGGTWYMFLAASSIPALFTIPQLVGAYLVWLLVVAGVLEIVRKKYLPAREEKPPQPVIDTNHVQS